MTTIRLDVEADLDLTVGAARIRVRGRGPHVDLFLPAPWHWPRLLRAARHASGTIDPLLRLAERAGLTVRARFGPFSRLLTPIA